MPGLRTQRVYEIYRKLCRYPLQCRISIGRAFLNNLSEVPLLTAAVAPPLRKLWRPKFPFTKPTFLTYSKTRCRPSKERQCIPDVVLKNEGSMVKTCRKINVHAVNTDIICWDQHECLWESKPIDVHRISKKLFTKHDSRNTKVSIF